MRYINVALLLILISGNVRAREPITIYLAGDSTMAHKLSEKRPETGWGEVLPKFFNEDKVRVENHAQNGRSTRTFIVEKRWQAIIERLKAGDYVLIQFGHNDEKENTDRYASPADYRRNLMKFVAEVREKKAIPVLLTPVMRRRFDQEGHFFDTHGEYPDAVRSVAADNKVALLDMHRLSERLIVGYGVESSKKLFLQLAAGESPNYPQGVEDNTHFSPLGADLMAGLVVAAMREQKLGLTKYLKKDDTGSATREMQAIPAFPGAEGFGSTTPGGRGGRVIFVTNLNDAGPGSFREACDAEGPRNIIFRVSGLITLASPIVIKNPYLTIAGQTAPGDGICIRNYTFVIATHDVVVRYLRSRLGDLTAQQADSITLISGAENVILDHCSASWSIDEVLSLTGTVSNVTVQWCLIAEALNHSKHVKGPHGYGSLSRASGPVTWHHNLWAHNNARNPRLGDNYGKPPYPTFDVRNNVIYDYGEIASGLTQGVLRVNYVANYIRPGPDSKARTPIRIGGPSNLTFYIRENVFEGNSALTADNAQFFDPVMIDGKRQVQTVAEPFDVHSVKTVSAPSAYEMVLRMVGASLPRRDPVDARLVDEVRQRKGSIIDSQEQVGGWPALKSTAAPVDTDRDGMPDSWEHRFGLNAGDPADGAADNNKDGYTNLDEYLNDTNPNKAIK